MARCRILTMLVAGILLAAVTCAAQPPSSRWTDEAYIRAELREHWSDLSGLTEMIGHWEVSHPSARYIDVYRRIADLNPSDDRAQWYLAVAYAKAGRKYEALEQARLVVRRWPNYATYVTDVFCQYKLYGEALTYLRRATDSRSGQDGYIARDLVRVYWLMGRRKEAAALADEIRRDKPDNAVIRDWISGVFAFYWRTKDIGGLAATIPDIEQILGEQVAENSARCADGRSIAEKRALAEALAVELRPCPSLSRSQFFLADLYVVTGQNRKLENLIHALRAARPHDVSVLQKLADLAGKIGPTGTALRLDIMRTISHLQPDDADVICNLAFAYLRLGQRDEAVRCARLLERSYGKNASELLRAAGIHEHVGRLDDAIRLYKAAMAAEPDYPGYWTLELAELCRKTGRTKESARLLRDLIQRTGWYNMKLQGFRQLADVYRDTGRIRELADTLVRTEQDVPEELGYTDELIYEPRMSLEKKALLAHTLSLVLSSKPELLECRLLLADLLADLGQSGDAYRLMNGVLDKAGNNAPLLRKMLRVCSQHSDRFSTFGDTVKAKLASIPPPTNPPQ